MDINGKVEGARAAGAVFVAGLWGLTWGDWAAALTAAYMLAQTILIAMKINDHIRSKKRKRK
jgi:hypothetical protein